MLAARGFTYGVLALGGLVPLALAGCAGRLMEASKQACSEFGFTPSTADFIRCTQTEFEQRRELIMRASGSRSQTTVPPSGAVTVDGKAYDTSECIGPVIIGRCEGSILPNRAYYPTCHGAWLNGQCTGPMF
jgi:hypothetical protein